MAAALYVPFQAGSTLSLYTDYTTSVLDKFNSQCYHLLINDAEHHHTDPNALAAIINVQHNAW